jgi:PAS domain S-box-containing protein
MEMSTEGDFRKVAETAPFAFVIARLTDGVFRFVNQRFCDMLGVAREDLLGRPSLDFYEQPADRKHLVDLLLQDGHYYEQEVRLKNKSGQVFWVSASAHSGEYEGEKVVFASLYDIDALKQTEMKLREQTEKLVKSNKELEQFAYIASHDLQEPLRMVASYLQLLQQRYMGQYDQDANDFINFAVDGASRMQQMINDLLTFSRVTTRGKPLADVSSEASFSHAMDNVKTNLDDSKGKVTTGKLPMVSADPVQLTMLFQNILSNAIKFRGEGDLQIHVSSRSADGMQEFQVSDNGIGIEPENFERVFGIFQKLHGRVDYPGTGIGLAVCQRIVARHGGRIWVESKPGEGATFYFTLPKAQAIDAKTEPVLQAEPA